MNKEAMRELYFEYGLYQKLPNAEQWKNYVDAIKWDESSYDAFCIVCNEETVYFAMKAKDVANQVRMPAKLGNPEETLKFNINWREGDAHGGPYQFDKQFSCTRCRSKAVVIIKAGPDGVMKIGSHPSTADFQLGELSSRLSISRNKIPKELSKAVGLKAHGAYIGAYAYLRRVFERLILDAENTAKSDEDWNANEFQKAKIQERIKLLSNHLPEAMVANRSAYGILSKGIHELSEEECAENFELLFELIAMILEEREDRARKKARIEKLTKSVSAISKSSKI